MTEHTWIDDRGNERCFVCGAGISDCDCTEEEIDDFFERVGLDYFNAYRTDKETD